MSYSIVSQMLPNSTTVWVHPGSISGVDILEPVVDARASVDVPSTSRDAARGMM